MTQSKKSGRREVPLDVEYKGEKIPVELDIVEDPKVVKPVTFFSRYKDDVLRFKMPEDRQMGPGKWKTIPGEYLNFTGRSLTTNDKEKIEFLRTHTEYGRTIFEFGVEAHVERIKELDDSGVMEHIGRLGKLGRLAERQWRLQGGA